ncbi:ABZJ_00895 family protein [Maritimibacter sp. DP1N21-5]|uniref:ABZJ_00895 family protein n=1 Tax=Maritimibacter sp. DP1N21-5 TaxID=2836867 RepID=UPI001C471CAE|nr:ABZJ_00895 family protein [Maritimibacter sp. DP1N21-5]MBV7408451.1 ABZJ_00895 family protein [Maritimibacter sp. DP1N21-5]
MQINFARYAGIYALLTVILALAPPMLGLPSALGFAAALPPLLASVVEGNAYARTKGGRPTGQTALFGAARMTAVALGVNLLVAGLVNAAMQGRLMSMAGEPSQIALMAVGLIVIQFGFNRLGLRLAPQSA